MALGTAVIPSSIILEGSRPDYGSLGLARNPFESIPVFSDLQPVRSNNYLEQCVRLLNAYVSAAPLTRPACIYLVGPSGCGKSAVLRTFTLKRDKRRRTLPLYTRFPLGGGIVTFYNEFLRRLPVSLLKILFLFAKNNPSSVTSSYIGRKLYSASFSNGLWKSRDEIRVSPQYAVKSIADLVAIILHETGKKRIALVLDEFEHAWARFTGAQKYNWEKTMVQLFLQLGPKILLVLPAVPESINVGGRPYLGMYNWKGVDLNRILNASSKNIMKVDCSMQSLKDCLCSIICREILDGRGEELRWSLMNTLGNYPALAAAILDMHDRILAMTRVQMS